MRAMKHQRSTRGFSLIELMVGLVVGLIVIGAVLALIMSIIRSNNQTILATRLTQEMRATMAVIAADIRRARGVADPYQIPNANPNALVHSDTANCIRYSYDGAAGGNFHTVSLRDGVVWLDAGANDAEALCMDGQPLNSSFVTITDLTFEPLVDAGVDVARARRFRVTLQGELADNDEIQRTLTQIVFARSVAGN